MKSFLFIAVFILINTSVISSDKPKGFIKSLINGNDNLEKFADKNELAKSKRLGINYDGVKNKFIISFDIDEKVKDEINKDSLKYELKENDLGNGYSKAEFSVPSLNYTKDFYFKNGNWISPVTYYSKDWTTKTSKYFIFKISKAKYFNDYCVNKLDKFVDSMSVLLGFDTQQLEKEKILYILCRDEKEIEQITGFSMRGQFITAIDGIITTYNTHFHELAHLLINYKLKNLSLYTLPFFMEGFAVAVGGRGGIAKRVLLDIGYFLQKSGFFTYDSIITNDGFYREDASLTYPVAGFYNAFLLKELGTEKYFQIYRSINGSLEFLKNISREQISLPDNSKFLKFLNDYGESPGTFISASDTNKYLRHSGRENTGKLLSVYFSRTGSYYKLSVTPLFVFSPENDTVQENYASRKYEEITGEKPDSYGGFKYGIVADSVSYSLYNFFTNELIESYSPGFSVEHQKIPMINGRYEFFIRKDIFENDVEGVISIKEIER